MILFQKFALKIKSFKSKIGIEYRIALFNGTQSIIPRAFDNKIENLRKIR